MNEKKLSWNVVEDLMPLYCERLTSEPTSREIEEHLEHCEPCRSAYEMMKNELNEKIEEQRDENGFAKEAAKRPQKNPFAKLKRKEFRRKILCFVAGLAVCVGLFIVAFVGVIKYDSTEVDIRYTASNRTDENGQTTYSVDFEIKAPEGAILEWRQVRKEEDPDWSGYAFYRQLKLPFDDRGEAPNEASIGYECGTPFTGEENIAFVFSDKTVVYNLREIAEAEKIQ